MAREAERSGAEARGDAPPGITVIYDGECPFCTRYATMLRLRDAAGPVRLVDARSNDPAVEEVKAAKLDLDEGMAVKHGGRLYHGADAVHLLAMLSTRSGVLNRALNAILASERGSRLLYPFLRAGRNAALRALGRKKINATR